MVYKMLMFVDGGCRGNGSPGAFGACACLVVRRSGRNVTFARRLPMWSHPEPTSQRAELCAIIIALEHAVEKQQDLDNNPYMDVTIHTDSRYAHGCMTQWYRKWQDNGFINSLGHPVANSDLIKKALNLENDILDHGNVVWEWIPRSENTAADERASEEMDEMEEEQ